MNEHKRSGEIDAIVVAVFILGSADTIAIAIIVALDVNETIVLPVTNGQVPIAAIITMVTNIMLEILIDICSTIAIHACIVGC